MGRVGNIRWLLTAPLTPSCLTYLLKKTGCDSPTCDRNGLTRPARGMRLCRYIRDHSKETEQHGDAPTW